MQAIEAVNMSVWAMAYHPNGRTLNKTERVKGDVKISVDISPLEILLEFSERGLPEALQELGLDDNKWEPMGPEGLYDVIDFS